MRPDGGHVGNLVPPQSHEAASHIVKPIIVKKVLMDYRKWSGHKEILPILTWQNHVLLILREFTVAEVKANSEIGRYVNWYTINNILKEFTVLIVRVEDDLLLPPWGWKQYISFWNDSSDL